VWSWDQLITYTMGGNNMIGFQGIFYDLLAETLYIGISMTRLQVDLGALPERRPDELPVERHALDE
jgi:hypothetical protein